MAHEITHNAATGLTLTARLVQAGAYVGAVITLTESGTVPGHYTGTPPGGTAAAIYDVLVFNGAARIADGTLDWTGTAERQAATAADIASAAAVAAAVRAELAVELARVDVVMSTRLAAGSYVAPSNAAIALIKSATENLPADPASQAAILDALAGLGGGGGGGTTGELAAEVLGATAGDGTVLDAMTRINELPAGVPVQLVPAAPVDVALCRVYGYFSTPDGQPAAGVKIEFKFISPGFTRSARIVAGRTVVATTSKLGELSSDAGPFLDLLRTDLLTTPGVTYQVSSAELGVKNKVITLTTETADLRALLAAA